MYPIKGRLPSFIDVVAHPDLYRRLSELMIGAHPHDADNKTLEEYWNAVTFTGKDKVNESSYPHDQLKKVLMCFLNDYYPKIQVFAMFYMIHYISLSGICHVMSCFI